MQQPCASSGSQGGGEASGASSHRVCCLSTCNCESCGIFHTYHHGAAADANPAGLHHDGVPWSCLQGPQDPLSRAEGSIGWHQQRLQVHEGTQTGSPPSQEIAAATEPACITVSPSAHQTAATCSLHTEADSNHCRRPGRVNPRAGLLLVWAWESCAVRTIGGTCSKY